MTTIERFFSKVDKSQGPLGCWLWTSATLNGYGVFFLKGKTVRSHRVSFEMMYGDMINEKPSICHKCDNTLCVNPIHLFLGTSKENKQDSISKNRHAKGKTHGQSKLTESDVYEIRNANPKTFRSIAKKYNIHLSIVYDIKNRDLWKSLPERENE